MVEDQIRFICNNCRYKFRRKVDWDSFLCPYCGKESVEKENTINKMIMDEL